MNFDRLNETLEISKTLTSLEWELEQWFRRMKAIQGLRRKYKTSTMAEKQFKAEEKIYKKKWWNSMQKLNTFKRQVGLM